MARTDPDYLPVYQAYGAGRGQLFSRISIPGADWVARLIGEAVLSENPKPVYAAGPLVDEILAPRTRLDDEAFDRFKGALLLDLAREGEVCRGLGRRDYCWPPRR